MRKNKRLKGLGAVLSLCIMVLFSINVSSKTVVVDTGQDKCYNNSNEISCPGAGSAFAGQDAQYNGTQPSYTDNGDGTITDNNTGLMWQKTPGDKMYYDQAVAGASSFNLAGYSDWRLPTIKELYSLIDFRGMTGMSAATSIPYLDTGYFDFNFGDTSAGERLIDAQYCSSTEYVSTTMNNNPTVFGVNFADGRIKGYPQQNKTYYVMYVRGAAGYGNNNFRDNGDGTVTDLSTGLMWMQVDSGHLGAGDKGDGGLNWEQALDWAENLTYAGYSDWRLPNAKELQGIVDYTRSPDTTNSPAINPVFQTTSIRDGNGQANYPHFWTGTTHLEGNRYSQAVYIAFGEGQGYMNYTLMDVHGAGCQRSDPKEGDPADYPWGRGPQGDVIYIYNYVRCVRVASAQTVTFNTLTVNSSPSGATISVSPADNNGSGSGTTSFTRTYVSGTAVTLTAPASYNGNSFNKWIVGSTEYTSASVQVTMNGDTTATAYYSSSGSTGELTLDKTQLTFRTVSGGQAASQTLGINMDGSGSFSWSAVAGASWLSVSPSSGSGNGTVTVSVNTGGLAAGSYSGSVTVSCAQASNSPVTVPVSLAINDNSGAKPFGSMDTPLNGAHVYGSIPVTGWVLDDVGVKSVGIYCTYGGSELFIGNAVFVHGARPDVAASYPDYPDNELAGWGYMLLTYGLPGKGNGVYTITAKAEDVEGNVVTLGSKTITCDNANAVKPFGAIDSPTQGGAASGNSYRVRGWVLTPLPNSLAANGSTISVFVDGKRVGSPVYNQYRSDIAGLFPGYVNSSGAGGYFDLDTTGYSDGVYTISWSVVDSAGNTEGIGSRFFTINNSENRVEGKSQINPKFKIQKAEPVPGVWGKKGFSSVEEAEELVADKNGELLIKIEELERIEVQLGKQGVVDNNAGLNGFVVVGDELKPLPIGSTLDEKEGIFYWQPGPGFLGVYELLFASGNVEGPGKTIKVTVVIEPKGSK